MTPAAQVKNHLSAQLLLLGQPPLQCQITQVYHNSLTIELPLAASVNTGEMAEIRTDNGFGTELVLRASVQSVAQTLLNLQFVDDGSTDVRQLINWFAKPDKTPLNQDNPANLIEDITQITLQQLSHYLDSYLLEVDSRLMSMTEWATSNDQQNKLFDIKSQLLAKAEQIKDVSLQSMKLNMHNALQNPDNLKPETPESENLELVDLKTFEDWLSIEGIINRSEDKNRQALLCLGQRYNHITGQNFNIDSIPICAQMFCRSLQTAFQQCQLPIEFLPVVYQIYEETVIDKLDHFYDTINAKLKSHNILPNVEAEILHKRRQPEQQEITKDSSTEVINNTTTEFNNQKQLFDSAKQLLNLSRGNNTSPDTTDNTVYCDQEQLIKQLLTLQSKFNTTEETKSEKLSEWINSHNALPISAETADLIKLVEALFLHLHNFPGIPKSVVNTLSKLQVPIARAALLDPSFFSATDHPVRNFINQLVDLCQNSDMPNPSLEKKFSSLVDEINDNFNEDDNVFSNALESLATISIQQASAYRRNTERVAQTYQGRQKVNQAQQAVTTEINRRIAPPEAPTIAIELLDNGWRELLKITYIKQGPNSNDWHKHLQTLDQLLLRLNERLTSAGVISIEQELEADSFTDLIDQHLNDLFPGDYKHHQTIESIRQILKGKDAVEMTTLCDSTEHKPHNPNQVLEELKNTHPSLNRWFKRAQTLKAGEEFAYLDDETGQRNIRLAWVSDDKQNFVFVNNRGQKVLDFDIVDLANELSKGLQPVEHQSEWPLVERCLYSTVQDAYQQLAYKSSHDELTGLINRKECEKQLSQILQDAKNNWKNHCLLYLDIDKFSLTNDLYGHVAGDDLLTSFSVFLTNALPKDSTIARMAGNEFVVLLKSRNIHEGRAIAESIRAETEEHSFNWNESNIPLTTSIGVVIINKYTNNIVDLIRNATTACQQAKSTGGNRCHDFEEGSDAQNHRDKLLTWIDQINNTLTHDRLILRGQPIQTVANDLPCDHYEILLAIKNDEGELESPVDFIEAAECYNRMHKVDRWVIERVFEWLSSLIQSSYAIPSVSINLSGNSINDEHFIDFLFSQFAKYKVPTEKICLEVTETATINNISAAADFIREVRKIGCKVSLDDYGSGNASYQYLKYLPVDYIKIDGAFIQDIVNNKDDYAMTCSINDIAHLMGKETIAEYAESESIIKVLQEIGVDYIQGYAISRPILLEDIPLHKACETETVV